MFEKEIMITAENIMGIYRNYGSVGKIHKILILIRIILEIVVSAAVFCRSFIVISPSIRLRENTTSLLMVYHLTFLLSGYIIIVCAVQSSHSYKLFINNFTEAKYFFWNVETYKKYTKPFKLVFILASSIFSFLNVIFIALRNSYTHIDEYYMVLLLIEIYIGIRYILVSTIFCAYISMLQYCLKSMNTHICDIKTKYTIMEKRQNSHISPENDLLTVAQVDEWVTKYQRLENCSTLLSECFRNQMLFLPAVLSVHYIVSTYLIFKAIIKGEKIYFVSALILLQSILYSWGCTYFIFTTGQKLLNEGVKFRRSLAKLYSLWSVDPEAPETTHLKNVIVFIKIHPIKIQYTEKITLGLYLVPTILSFFVTYVIVALQWNHII